MLCSRLAQRPETRAQLRPVALDIGADIEAAIGALAPNIVVDCSGPFQRYGYRAPLAALAALAAGAQFVDLADARGYILGFEAALDGPARAKGLVALTGASSSPALAAAVAATLTAGWRRIDHIAIAITPGGRSDVGDAAVKAALSYCGAPVPTVRFGELDSEIGWGGGERIEVPGLGCRAVAPVETADAELLSRCYPVAASIRFRAGLESWPEHQGMRLLSGLRRLHLLPRPERLAPMLALARRLTRLFTGNHGAMIVRVSGVDQNGGWREAEWSLLAKDNCGPHVPPAPAAAVIRAILAGGVQPGAAPALGVPLAAIEAELRPHAIATARGFRTAAESVVERAVGSQAFLRLPPVVARFHALDGEAVWRGEASVQGAATALGGLVARLVGFPPAARSLPVAVMVERRPAGQDGTPPDEIWTRRFGDRSFRSVFSSSRDGRAIERFGPFRFRLGLAVDPEGRLAYPVLGWSLGRAALPRWLMPRSETFEWQDEQGRFRFEVDVSLPFLGRLVGYSGWLTPAPQAASGGVAANAADL